ncbi:MAG TPA: replication protein, partial [Pyrinomonadaceae bacterium]|nr:replication protein [Pyrinomonadaceae bacterium]
PESSQPQEGSQPPQVPQKNVDLIVSLPEVAGRLEMPHQIVDHLLRLLDPYEQAVYIQLYRLSWGFNKPNCSISNRKLAERAGMPESTVKKTLGKLKAKGLIKKTGLQIGYGKEQGIDFWVAAPSSQLQRSRQLQESSQLPQVHSNRKALKENIKKGNELSLDTKSCPDCQGSGFWYPEGVEKGVAKCKHARLAEGK